MSNCKETKAESEAKAVDPGQPSDLHSRALRAGDPRRGKGRRLTRQDTKTIPTRGVPILISVIEELSSLNPADATPKTRP